MAPSFISKIETHMKKAVLAVLAAGVTLFAVAPAFAAPPPHHHHQVCHKVRVHHHWERRCH
jgi:hypothetical protein